MDAVGETLSPNGEGAQAQLRHTAIVRRALGSVPSKLVFRGLWATSHSKNKSYPPSIEVFAVPTEISLGSPKLTINNGGNLWLLI
jgi:hypothetical protein